MSVIIHVNKKQAITWNDADFSWDSADCLKSWDDFYFVDYDALVQESIPFDNEFDRALGRKFKEHFTIKSSLVKQINKNIVEKIMVSTRLERIATFIRELEENVYISSESKKFIRKEFNEAFTIFDEWIRRANAVYSDVYISNLATSYEAFEQELKRGSPVGYSDFTTYIPGYYEFESAMFRMVIRSTGLDRIRLKKLKMVVDVPDVFDRGDSMINAGAEKTVYFNRKYIKPPKVIAIQSGGEKQAQKVEIFGITKTEFKYRLLDEAGNKIAGTISWISEGY